MLNRLQHICYAIVLCFLVASCQSDQEASTPQSSIQKQVPAQVQIDKPQKAPVQDDIKEESPATPPAVNLDLSKELLEKITANSQQELTVELQEKMEIEAAEQRKVKISGGVLIDKNENELAKKMDGGEVKISVPFN